MADVSKARTGELLRELFQLLLACPEGMQASEALATLLQRVTLSPYEAGDYASGGRRFERIVRFATVDCVKAGWLIKQKGIWSVSDEGRRALQAFPNPEAFYREAKRLYQKWRKGQPSPIDAEIDIDPAESSAAITLEQAEEWAWKEIEEYLSQIPPYEFQSLIGELLRAMGYHVAWEAPPGKDGGVDLIAYNDPLGTRPPRIKVQVKRNANSARVDVIGLRSFMAVLAEGDVGLFVALSGFTRDAELEARQSHRRLTLLDAKSLTELWTNHHSQLSDQARRMLPMRPVWFLAVEE